MASSTVSTDDIKRQSEWNDDEKKDYIKRTFQQM
jgi:hypothetical protein